MNQPDIMTLPKDKLFLSEQTWRWYGPDDPVSLWDIKQAGATGIVNALHHIPNGEVWTVEEIMKRKELIESVGLKWSVVESVPVHEHIKTQTGNFRKYIENYKESLRNLGQCGIHIVTYNFMPVLDWARTDLEHPNPDGTSSLYFDRADFAYFDCCILKREGAEADYGADIMEQVERKKAVMTPEDDHKLVENIIIKTQGFVNGNIKEDDEKPVEIFRELLGLYKGIDRDALRENMRYFLSAVMPVCEQYGVDMCVHPDDPPLQILGLPRIVTCDEDIAWFLNAVDNPHNGLTFCAGSLSAGAHNNVPELARKYASRTKFVHLRSTGCPTIAAFRCPSIIITLASFSFSFGVRIYAPRLTNSALTASYTSLTAITDCSDAQIIPLSKVLDIKIEETAI